MSLIRWEPLGDVDALFNRLLPRGYARWPQAALESAGRKLEWSPSADISETDKEYVIRAELPAVKKEDVQVTLDAGIITIRGERKQLKDDKSESTTASSLSTEASNAAFRCRRMSTRTQSAARARMVSSPCTSQRSRRKVRSRSRSACNDRRVTGSSTSRQAS
jgi:HSP20 family molecular chaperone IbpA